MSDARVPLTVGVDAFTRVANDLRMATAIAELAIRAAENHGVSAHITTRLRDVLERIGSTSTCR